MNNQPARQRGKFISVARAVLALQARRPLDRNASPSGDGSVDTSLTFPTSEQLPHKRSDLTADMGEDVITRWKVMQPETCVRSHVS
jgi:hypothetical protein